MIEKTNDVRPIIKQDIDKADKEYNRFRKKTIGLSALACNNFRKDDFNIDKAADESQNDFNALGATGGLQEMLAAQMLSIHRLQQISTAMANEAIHSEVKQCYTNSSIKLANVFVQQANLLSKLQGNGGQKIIVEHVEVHQGGQAIVGNIKGAP